MAGNKTLEGAFAWPLSRARRVREQNQRQRGAKIYSLHAPEVECIGKGKVIDLTRWGQGERRRNALTHATGGQFVTHAKTRPGKPSQSNASGRHSRDGNPCRQLHHARHGRHRLQRPQRAART